MNISKKCKKVLNCCFSITKSIPVLFIVAIIAWSYYAYVVALCTYTITSIIEKLSFLFFYHILLSIFLFSYYKTSFTNSMEPSRNFYIIREWDEFISKPNETAQKSFLENIIHQRNLPVYTRSVNFAIRTCAKCKLIKPDRSHHCSTCGKCVLKMDHHCPWVNNCVGFHNYKYFILFLTYGFFYCLFITMTSLKYFISFWVHESLSVSKASSFHVLFLFFVAVMFAFSLFGLSSYHYFLSSRNRTTLESFRSPIFVTGQQKNGYNLGVYRNFRELFGVGWRCFLPVKNFNQGSGMTFEHASTELSSAALLNAAECGAADELHDDSCCSGSSQEEYTAATLNQFYPPITSASSLSE